VLHRLIIRAFRVLPWPVRMAVVRLTTPSYTIGVQVLIRRPDGRILLVKQPYRSTWYLPGGNVKGKETALEGAHREIGEELGLGGEIRLVGCPAQAPLARWLTWFAAVDVDDATADSVSSHSPEISGLRWWLPYESDDVDEAVRQALRFADEPLPAWRTARSV
jgi:ADP-ribose pyrophosphatase YjhB (NUDIX family)